MTTKLIHINGTMIEGEMYHALRYTTHRDGWLTVKYCTADPVTGSLVDRVARCLDKAQAIHFRTWLKANRQPKPLSQRAKLLKLMQQLDALAVALNDAPSWLNSGALQMNLALVEGQIQQHFEAQTQVLVDTLDTGLEAIRLRTRQA